MTKYKAQKTKVDGIVFASKKEAKRYSELKLLRRLGEIEDLLLQVDFPVFINGIKIFSYKADFVYQENGKPVVEDVKGMKTPVYRIKKKAVEAAYAIKIRET